MRVVFNQIDSVWNHPSYQYWWGSIVEMISPPSGLFSWVSNIGCISDEPVEPVSTCFKIGWAELLVKKLSVDLGSCVRDIERDSENVLGWLFNALSCAIFALRFVRQIRSSFVPFQCRGIITRKMHIGTTLFVCFTLCQKVLKPLLLLLSIMKNALI